MAQCKEHDWKPAMVSIKNSCFIVCKCATCKKTGDSAYGILSKPLPGVEYIKPEELSEEFRKGLEKLARIYEEAPDYGSLYL